MTLYFYKTLQFIKHVHEHLFASSSTSSFPETPSGLSGYCLDLQMALVHEIDALVTKLAR